MLAESYRASLLLCDPQTGPCVVSFEADSAFRKLLRCCFLRSQRNRSTRSLDTTLSSWLSWTSCGLRGFMYHSQHPVVLTTDVSEEDMLPKMVNAMAATLWFPAAHGVTIFLNTQHRYTLCCRPDCAVA